MKELVQYLARQLVNNPDAVEVKETQGDTASVVELKGRLPLSARLSISRGDFKPLHQLRCRRVAWGPRPGDNPPRT